MNEKIEKLQSCREDFEEQSIKCFFVWLNAHFFFDLPPHSVVLNWVCVFFSLF